MTRVSHHAEWLSLLEVSGSFLVPRVLDEVLPQGLEQVATRTRQRLREAYDEWREAVDVDAGDLDRVHDAWIHMVLEEGLEYDARILAAGDEVPGRLAHEVREHGERVRPDMAVVDRTGIGESRPILPIFVYPPDVDLVRPLAGARWPASPIDRCIAVCRDSGTRIGLVTNGERWALVHAARDGVSGHASWYARLWWQEPITFRAFRTLLAARRHFGPDDETVPALLDRSLEYQDEVTARLGEQVLRAVEVLVQVLDRANLDRNGELLCDVSPERLYEAALTVMMRLVFLLAAEERGLLLLGEPLYDSYYAVSTLRAQLRERADREGLEVLERRYEAWSRLLATFRAIYAGVEHPSLRLPALGGSLFDPDRFPFLEGRPAGSHWRDTPAYPLPIDDRTVLLFLESLQVLEDRGGARLLSYRGLDVEQIGYVYEGLLEHTVARIRETTLGLRGSSKAPNPNVRLAELESALLDGEARLLDLLESRTGRSRSALRRDLERVPDEEALGRLRLACGGDRRLVERVRPFVHLLRTDVWGHPLVYRTGAFAVTHGADRRKTASHYTPKALTEVIVTETLEPLVYEGPAEGELRERWRLRSAAQLLDLKICDPAVGSGAFLLQACRWLSERLVEAWRREDDEGRVVGMDGLPHSPEEAVEPIPKEEDERLVIAQRLVAERCLYGVDVNPLALELAKLSIWLVTLSKGRPLEFLDHNLRCGDSLLGLRDLDQLLFLNLNPDRSTHRPLFAQNIEQAVEESLEWRRTIQATPIRDVRDVRDVAEMEEESRRVVEAPKIVADALVGLALASAGDERKAKATWEELSIDVGRFLAGDVEAGRRISRLARKTLDTDLPAGKPPRRPFHWPLEFPEVFQRENGGFDAIMGNPPYRGGSRLTNDVGAKYRDYLIVYLTEGLRGRVDLCVYFLRRDMDLLRKNGVAGLVLTSSVAQGHSRTAGLDSIINHGYTVIYAIPRYQWPGKANVVVALLCIAKTSWKGVVYLGGSRVQGISPSLTPHEDSTVHITHAMPLAANRDLCFRGVEIRGKGFLLGEGTARALLRKDPRNASVITPFLTGSELNSRWDLRPRTYVINFGDMSLEEANQYPDCFQIVLDKVKPYRENLTGQIHESCFWKFWDRRTNQFESLRGASEYLVKARDSSVWAFAYVPSEYVISSKVLIFKERSYWFFACLQSSLHQTWCEYGASRIGRAITYNPTLGLRRYPFPFESLNRLSNRGRQYYTTRQGIMRELHWGLTALYNRFHDPGENDPRIQELRELHRQIDEAVAEAYGWDDLDLEHDFHKVEYLPENDRVRFTISERARREVLRRLARLNKERYEEEVRAGLHADTRSKARRPRTRSRDRRAVVLPFPEKKRRYDERAVQRVPMVAESSPSHGAGQPSAPGSGADVPDPDARSILEFLRSAPGWHSKSDILRATGVKPRSWQTEIRHLLGEGLVERRGERRGTRYRYSQRLQRR